MHLAPAPLLPSLLPGGDRRSSSISTITLPTPDFRMLREARRQLRLYLEQWDTSTACIDMLSFTVCEILTNLIKHPAQKATQVKITLRRQHTYVEMDIADDATPFATFVAECNRARGRKVDDTFCEGGYGLSCLLRLHTDMTYTTATDAPDGLNHFATRTALSAAARRSSAEVLADPLLPLNTLKTKPLVYLIDDNTVTLALYRQFLEDHYTVATFEYAGDALARFEQDQPAVIISEVELPEIDGMMLRRQLATLTRGNEIPFIFLSSTPTKIHETHINMMGIDDFLCKPVSPERLLSVVGRLLRRSAQVASAVHGHFEQKISAMLHPSMPLHFHNWRIATRSSLAEAGGGDFILHQQSGDHLFVVMADVMGHGQDAKFFACAYAGYLRSLMQVLGENAHTDGFLQKLSAALYADSFFDTTLMTCLAFQLGTDRVVRLATAGHPPPSLCMRGNPHPKTVMFNMSGPLPGLMADNTYTQHRLRLRTGDRLLIATDGYWRVDEQRQDVHRTLASVQNLDIEQAADILWQKHLNEDDQTAKHRDDVTLIMIEAGEIL